jgi:DNA mismatch repair protein MutL
MALSYPNIKFTLINNDKVLLKTDGNGDLLKVIYEIYGADITKKMIPIESENDDYYIHGYISYPEVTKGNRNSITTLVNGRVIKNNELNKCMVDCYHTYIHKDRYPVIILNIDVDPILVDINIHPTKMDIKFSKMDTLKDLIISCFTKTLEELTLIPEVSVRDSYSVSEVRRQITNDQKEEKKEEKEKYEEIKLDFEVQEEKREIEEKIIGDLPFEVEEDKKISRIKKMIPRGVVLLTYIVAENEDGMYLIDQHAAKERINYEIVLNKLTNPKKESISMLVPLTLEFSNSEYTILKENFDFLRELNFDIDEFGVNSVIIKAHPVWLPLGNENNAIKKILELVIEKEKGFSIERFNDHIAATMACKMSIKANTSITLKEMENLLNDLKNCKNPYNCPHGRPTVISYSNYDLEKLFKRSGF